MALSDRHIRNAQFRESAHEIFDQSQHNHVVCPGGFEVWHMNYKFMDESRTLFIGSYPAISLKVTRDKCAKAHRLLANFVDPSKIGFLLGISSSVAPRRDAQSSNIINPNHKLKSLLCNFARAGLRVPCRRKSRIWSLAT